MSKIVAQNTRTEGMDKRSVTGTDFESEDKRALDVYVMGGALGSSGAKIIIIENASSSITYFGYADPGSAESDASWKILRKEVVSSTKTEFKYANSSPTYDNVWDDRASLTYG